MIFENPLKINGIRLQFRSLQKSGVTIECQNPRKNSKYETLHIFFKVLATKNIVVHCS